MKNWLKEPLVHFVFLGALIFAVSSWYSGDAPGENDIYVSVARQDNLRQLFERTWQRPPSDVETQGLIDDFIREEIAYRESRKRQLDSDDIVIRRRLRQKLELLAEDVASLVPPSDEVLLELLENEPERYRQPAVFSLQQLYFSEDDQLQSIEQQIQAAMEDLQAGASGAALATSAGASMLPPSMTDVSEVHVDRVFGDGFALAALQFDEGVWSGPVRSGFGLHLVRVDDITPGYLPNIDEVRDELQRDWLYDRRNSAIDELYARFSADYNIKVEPR